MNHVSPELFLLIMAQLYYQIAKIFGRVAINLNMISTELNTFGCVIIPLLVLINMKNRSVLLPFFSIKRNQSTILGLLKGILSCDCGISDTS